MEQIPEWAMAAIVGVMMLVFMFFVIRGRKKAETTPLPRTSSIASAMRMPMTATTASAPDPAPVTADAPDPGPQTSAVLSETPIDPDEEHEVEDPKAAARGHEMEKAMPEQAQGTPPEHSNAGRPVETPTPRAQVVIKDAKAPPQTVADKVRQNSEYQPENPPGGRPDSKMPGTKEE